MNFGKANISTFKITNINCFIERRKADMTNFRSLNSSHSNIQSVSDHTEEAKLSKQALIQERKQSAFNKYNINGENQRGDDLERSKNQ